MFADEGELEPTKTLNEEVKELKGNSVASTDSVEEMERRFEKVRSICLSQIFEPKKF